MEFHAEIGMALIVQVGEKGDMKPVPSHFPKCGNFMPEPLLDEHNDFKDPETDQENSSNISAANMLIHVIVIFVTFLIQS